VSTAQMADGGDSVNPKPAPPLNGSASAENEPLNGDARPDADIDINDRALDSARDLLRLYHDAADGRDGVLMLVPIADKARPQKFRIGDVEGMATEAVTRGTTSNVYFAPALIRRDIQNGKRGKATDIVAQLGLVIDDDLDTGKAAILPSIEPTAIVETCRVPAINRHIHYAFTRALPPAEAAALAELLYRKCGGDTGTKDTAHVWRVPGTLNYPTEAKIKRGRPAEPQPVMLIGGTMEAVDPDDLRRALESMPDLEPMTSRSNRNTEEAPGKNGNGGFAAELIAKLPRKLAKALGTEGTGDRSKHSYKVMCRLFEAGMSSADVAVIARDPSSLFARKYEARGDLEEEIARARERWNETKAKRDAKADGSLAWMNERYAVVKVSGKTRVVTLEDDRGAQVPVYSTLRDFRDFEDKYRISDDGKLVGRGTWWINHPSRRQYDAVVFDPGATDNPRRFNLWRGFIVAPDDSGGCSLYLANITDNVCAGNDEHATYLLNLLAWKVQNPGRRPEVAVVLRGGQGTGKGTMINCYGELFGPHYLHVTDPKHLTGNFNAHLQQACVVFADEAFFAGDRKHDGKLKGLITEPTLVIEPKGVDSFTVPNRLMIFMASNNDWVIPADADDRRYFVLSVSDARKQDRAYFKEIAAEMQSGGRAALLDFLLKRDLEDFDVGNVPKTEALADQKARSRRDVDLLVELLAAEGELPEAHRNHPDIAITSGESRGEGFWPRARRLVADLKYQNSRVIAARLKDEWGCEPWESHGRSGLRFPPLSTLREKFDRKYGPQDWGSARTSWRSNFSPPANG
jgi:Family of unknown function (DUF5906)/RepB DNA-primase from phage plasmid